MEMATAALKKFYAHIAEKETNEIFFKYNGNEYQISYFGRYILIENSTTHDAEEFCFPQTGTALIEALLDAKVDDSGKTIREIISLLPEKDLLVTI